MVGLKIDVFPVDLKIKGTKNIRSIKKRKGKITKTDFPLRLNRSISLLMTDHPVSFEISKCIENLEFISSIPENHKPYYNSKSTISTNSWFTTVRRRWGGEKGEEGIIHVNNLRDSCDHHYRMCLKSLNGPVSEKDYIIETMQKLRTALDNSVIGFDNLINTYRDQKEVSDDYKESKKKVIALSKEIGQTLHQLNNSSDNNTSENIEDEVSSENSNSSSGYGFTDYISGWGVMDDYDYPYDSEKNPIVLSSMDSTVLSSKPSFFTTNNMVLMKTRRKKRLVRKVSKN